MRPTVLLPVSLSLLLSLSLTFRVSVVPSNVKEAEVHGGRVSQPQNYSQRRPYGCRMWRLIHPSLEAGLAATGRLTTYMHTYMQTTSLP